ncbi:MAG: glycosyltransferase family 9 protein [Candidatus Hydrogenedentes bacterium]|nr:glycosyltransferase family 9 protein [Candidatus Hydrogenedentota bacterium]
MRARLVVHTGGIGDFLLTCPAIREWAGREPVDLLGHIERLDLAVHGGLARKTYDLDSVEFASVLREPSTQLRAFFENYDRVVVWMRDDDGTIKRNIRDCGVVEVNVLPGLPPEDWTRHASEYYLSRLGCESDDPIRLNIQPAHDAHDVIIHPGSGSPKKNWPLKRFIGLATHLRDTARTVTWCLGPAEIESIRFAEIADEPTLRIESLADLAATLANTRRFIGNDSGIAHLAAAVGAPTTVLFGPTDPAIWAPRGSHVTVVQGDPWPDVASVSAQAMRS